MNFIITLILLIFILGFIVLFHELGHFLMAKKAKVYVAEFSIGMGPKIFGFKRKNDETEYTVRAFPIGGFVAMANEEDEEFKIKKDRILSNKTFLQKIFVLSFGIIFNFILAIILFFFNGLFFGSPELKPYIGKIIENSAAQNAGLREKDLVKSVGGVKVSSWNDVLLELNTNKDRINYKFVVERDKKSFTTTITPKIEKDENNNKIKVFGFGTFEGKNYGFVNAVKYSFESTYKLTKSIFSILKNLFTGNLGINSLSGPVGIYTVVDDIKSKGLESIVYLLSYLSINIAIINLIPIPVFDGGRILIVIIEKIKGGKLNPNIEKYLDYFGFALLITLFIFVTFNDIIKLL